MEIVLQAVVLAIAGLVIGVFAGLLGVGGGTMMVPLMRLGFGFEAVFATATSLFTIIFTSIGGAVTHLKNKTCIWQLGICLGLGGAVTSSFGAYLGEISPGWAIVLVAAVVIVYSAYNMLSKALRLPSTPAEPSRSPRRTEARSARLSGPSEALGSLREERASTPAEPSREATEANDAPVEAAQQDAQIEQYDFTFKRGLGGVLVGLIAGLASGYVGVGGGFIMVPLMTSFLGVPMKKASGTSLVAILILAIPGVITQIMLENVDFLAGVFLAIGSIPGATIGARLVTRIPERQLRFIFAAFLAVAAILLLVNEAGLLG